MFDGFKSDVNMSKKNLQCPFLLTQSSLSIETTIWPNLGHPLVTKTYILCHSHERFIGKHIFLLCIKVSKKDKKFTLRMLLNHQT